METLKPWPEMTERDIGILKRQQCSKCFYFSPLPSATAANSNCDYWDIEKHSRGCSPLECRERGIFKPRKKRKK